MRAAPEPTPEDHRLARRLRAKRRARQAVTRFAVILLIPGAVAGAIALELPERFAQLVATNEAPVQQTAPIPEAAAGPAPTGIPAEALPATVDYVHDGDTLFLLLDGERLKVRLIGIDTPEVGEHAECYGEEATAALRALLPEGSTVHALTDGGTHDQYDRSLFYLFRDDATLVNVELVASGAAATLLISDNNRYWPELEAAEQAARAAALGLWGAC